MIIIQGRVVKGKQLGRRLGFPTANIEPDTAVCIPYGVYAGRVTVRAKEYASLINVGRHPTFPDGAPTIEAWLSGFDADIYGETVSVSFNRLIRCETRFGSADELMSQIRRDIQEIGKDM